MTIAALTRLAGSRCATLRFPVEVNVCECVGLESVLLYTGRVHSSAVISSQLIALFGSAARPAPS